MSISRKLMTAAGGGEPAYVDDVFSTYLYDGTAATNQIVNGIDLADKGGMVWTKCRNNAYGHILHDSEMAPESFLSSDGTAAIYGPASAGADTVLSLNADGYTLGNSQFVNENTRTYASWTFAKQEGFFDVVTYTGDAVAGREIPHNLGSTPGMIIVKSTTRVDSWAVYHRSMGNQYELRLNMDIAKDDDIKYWNYTDPTDTVFTVGTDSQINGAGEEYVAYVFAHDAQEFGPNGNESIIKCGEMQSATVDLGWEPQFVLLKSKNLVQNWILMDNMRAYGGTGTDVDTAVLSPNTSSAEVTSFQYGSLTPTGFSIGNLGGNNSLLYMAIRRPHKPAEEFTPGELFAMAPNNQTSAPYYEAGFPVDAAFARSPASAGSTRMVSRLMQGEYLTTNSNSASATDSDEMFDYSTGYNAGSTPSTQSWMFRRSPGFFDVVTWAGNAQQGRQIPHNLRAAPEMIWVKETTGTNPWIVYSTALTIRNSLPVNPEEVYLVLNERSTVAAENPSYRTWGDVFTEEVFSVGKDGGANGSFNDYIAFLWASVPGFCDIGSYTGTGADLDIGCGFTHGARFVLIKRTDLDGDWYFWDTVRGISSGNDPYLLLNDTASQVTSTDYIDPLSSGFTVTASASAELNDSGGEYLYMAIA